IVSVVVVEVVTVLAVVCWTKTVCPLTIDPWLVCNVSLQPIEYWPFVIVTVDDVLMPLIVIVFEIAVALRSTFDCESKPNASGTESHGTVVTLTPPPRGAPAIVTFTVVVVLQVAEAYWRSVTCE